MKNAMQKIYCDKYHETYTIWKIQTQGEKYNMSNST